jgi:hypothetical protein
MSISGVDTLGTLSGSPTARLNRLYEGVYTSMGFTQTFASQVHQTNPKASTRTTRSTRRLLLTLDLLVQRRELME